MKQIEKHKHLKLKKKSYRIDTIITQENIEGCIYISCKELQEAKICYWLEKLDKKYISYRCKGKNKQPISQPHRDRPKWCPLLKLK